MTTVFSLNEPVDLEKIAMSDKFFEYKPLLYSGVVFKLMKPRLGFTIFSSGKVVCTGGKCLEEISDGVDILSKHLELVGISCNKISDPKICNIVAVTDFYNSIDVESLALSLNALYEPEQFPAIIYRLKRGKLVSLIFSSGKTIITGARTFADVEYGYSEILKILLEKEQEQQQL